MSQSQLESIAHFRSAKKCHNISNRISGDASKQVWNNRSWLHLLYSVAYLTGDMT